MFSTKFLSSQKLKVKTDEKNNFLYLTFTMRFVYFNICCFEPRRKAYFSYCKLFTRLSNFYPGQFLSVTSSEADENDTLKTFGNYNLKE